MTTKPHLVLRDRMGGVPEALKAHVKEHNARKKAVTRALTAHGSMTVPQLAQVAGLEPSVALWMLMTLRRQGSVVESGEAGDYVRYTLIQGS